MSDSKVLEPPLDLVRLRAVLNEATSDCLADKQRERETRERLPSPFRFLRTKKKPGSRCLLSQTPAAHRQTADRLPWSLGGPRVGPHIYEFSIRGAQVRGIYCTVCNDATTLAFVDGRLSEYGMTFVVTHVRDDGSTAYVDHVAAKLDRGQLLVQGISGAPDGGRFRWAMRKDPRGPAPVPGTRAARASAARISRTMPAPSPGRNPVGLSS